MDAWMYVCIWGVSKGALRPFSYVMLSHLRFQLHLVPADGLDFCLHTDLDMKCYKTAPARLKCPGDQAQTSIGPDSCIRGFADSQVCDCLGASTLTIGECVSFLEFNFDLETCSMFQLLGTST